MPGYTGNNIYSSHSLRILYLRYNCVFTFRYDKAVDPNEDATEKNSKVDQYAFAVLVDDVFKGCSDGKEILYIIINVQ